MIRKLLTIFLMLMLCAAFLAGCQLAVPEDDNTGSALDPLIGVYITEEYLDLIDMEGWLQENAGKLSTGNTVLADPPSEKLHGTITEEGITFPGTNGLVLASYYALAPEADSGYWATIADPGINHIHAAYNRGDDGDAVEISASIYLSKDAQERVFYFNPIYQTVSGEVYVCSGQGMSMSGGLGGEMGQQTKAEAPEGPQGDGMRYSGSFDIRVKSVEVPRSVTLLQLDKDHNILRQDTYTPYTMPQEVTPAAGTAYILVESKMAEEIQRFLNQPGDDPVETYLPMDGGLCDIVSTQILWPESE